MKRTGNALPYQYAALQGGFWMDYLIVASFGVAVLKARGFDPQEISWVTTISAVLTIVFQMSLSTLADRSEKVSLRTLLMLLLGASGSAALAMTLLPAVHGVSFVGFFLALSLVNTVSPLLTSICLQYNAAGARLNFGAARSIGSLGYAAAGFAMGAVTEKWGPEIALPIFVAVTALLLLLIWTMPAPVRVRPVPNPAAEQTPAEAPTSLLRFFRRYPRYALFLGAVMLMFWMQMLLNTYMIYFVEDLGGDEQAMGAVLSVAAFSEIPTIFLGVKLVERFGAKKLLRVSAAAGVVKYALMLLITDVGLFIPLHAVHFFYSGLYMVSAVYFADSIVRRADMVKAQTLLAVGSSGVAGIAANLVGGVLLRDGGPGPQAAKWIGLAAAAAGLVLMLLATSGKGKAEE